MPNKEVNLKTNIGRANNRVSVFENSLRKSEEWISEMQSELNWLSHDNIYNILRAVLHALRDQLSVDEAAHFSAQLPMLLRGAFYESWNPQKNQAKGLTKDDFLKSVRQKMEQNKNTNINFDFETGVVVALSTIMNHVSAGEMGDIIQSTKPSLKIFFDTIENFNLGCKYQ